MSHALPDASTSAAGRLVRFFTVSQARELGILLTLSVMFPFMVHLVPVPGDGQLGPRLLPMFYAPLLAALWGRTRSGVALALVAPWLNWVLTSHPAPPGAVVASVELLGFVLAARFLLAEVGARWFLAAPAFLAAKAASICLAGLVPGLIAHQPVFAWAARGIVVGAPGIAILLLINWLVVRFYPPAAAGGGGPAAA